MPIFGVDFHNNKLILVKNSSSKLRLKLSIVSTDVVGCCDLFNRRLENEPIRHCRFVARCEQKLTRDEAYFRKNYGWLARLFCPVLVQLRLDHVSIDVFTFKLTKIYPLVHQAGA